MRYRILALCAGFGGLELAVSSLVGGTVVAFAENDPYAARVFEHHHPGVPNLGDISAVEWAAVLEEHRPDVITAGWPCRNISNAGDRSGIDGQWSKVWRHVAEAVGVVRPRLVFMENVAALTRRGLPRVLGDLAGHGYDARWTCVRASETIGACHPRYRWFGIAHPASDPDVGRWHRGAGDVAESDWRGELAHSGDASAGAGELSLLPTPLASDAIQGTGHRNASGTYYLTGQAVRLDAQWLGSNGKDYGPAVRRWERVTGRPAPCPTETGTKGNRRLSPAFEEWMMGLPAGHVTAVPDIPRREQMRIIGNGVVWQQGRHAYTYLLTSDDFEMERQDDMRDETETKTEKPRGKCTGCKFDYQLGTARSGDYKGQLVIRKHLSRVGPGECDGSRKPPAIEHGEATGDAQAFDVSQFADLAPVQDTCACGGVDPDCPNGCGSHVASKHGFGHCTQGNCTGCCGCSSMCTTDPCGQPEQLPHDRGHETITHIPNGHDFTDSSGTVWRHGGDFKDCTVVDCIQFRNRLNPPPADTPVQHQCENGLYADIRNCPRHGVPTTVERLAQTAAAAFPDPTPVAVAPGGSPVFADPTPAPAELPPVSGQPEPERDQWGRYKILGVSHTRATTFAKLGSSTYALGEWNERMLILGLSKRPDLLAMAHGLDVKRDSKTLNKIADDAQEFAGNKVAANIGTAYHTFTERLDAGVITLDDVPAQWRGRCKQYVDALAAHGLTTRREWIERTTAVRADQVSAPVPVAGTLDRILRMPNGDLVIGDLKTSSNIEYSWSEIAVQLALYAHGVNTFGLFDWNRKEWETHDVTAAPGIARLRVRTDYAIVMHLPANGDGCTLYRVDLVKGWKFAQVSGLVQSRQKAKDVAGVMVPLPQTVPAPVLAAAEGPAPVVRRERPEMAHARSVVETCTDPDGLVTLHQQAVDAGLFDAGELFEIQQLCADRWAVLNTPAELEIPY